ncbi:MAG: beta-L-arabinofuranosidase domain-containing protein, partial [Terracidiphilus sp.]
GWYSTYAFAPACTYGQWLSALARMYAVTRDEPTRAKIDRMIRGYAATIEPEGRFYRHYRFPAYMFDKLNLGLTDAYVYAQHPLALQVLARTTDAVLPYLPPKAQPHQETPVRHGEDFTRHVDDESYTLPENLFLAWQRTGDARYFELGKRFIFHEYFDPLSRGENALPGRHAYSHVNALSSAAASYLAMGETKYFHAARNAFGFVQQQSYATGGWGPREHFVTPGQGKLAASLTNTHASFETPCGSYAHFKIARYLMRITGDSRYGDSMERVLYNTVLGAKPILPDGSAFYYSDYNFKGVKVYHGAKWPCCSGTLPQIAADYRISAYFRGSKGVYVNLYTPSTLRWNGYRGQFSLRQTSDYPYDSQIRLDVTASAPAVFSVFLRIPEWAHGAAYMVNGMRGSRQVRPGSFAPGSFVEVRREWKTGDRIELDLPFTSRLEPIDGENPDTVALVAGPLALMAIESGGLEPGPVTRAALLGARQTGPRAHEWTAGAGAGVLRLKPFLDIQEERYTTYLNVAQA